MVSDILTTTNALHSTAMHSVANPNDIKRHRITAVNEISLCMPPQDLNDRASAFVVLAYFFFAVFYLLTKLAVDGTARRDDVDDLRKKVREDISGAERRLDDRLDRIEDKIIKLRLHK